MKQCESTIHTLSVPEHYMYAGGVLRHWSIMLTLPSEDLPISHTSNHHTLHTLSTESLVSHLCAPTRYVSTNATSDHSSASDTQQTSFIEPNDDGKNKARTSICDAPQRIAWRFEFPLESRLAAHQRYTRKSPTKVHDTRRKIRQSRLDRPSRPNIGILCDRDLLVGKTA